MAWVGCLDGAAIYPPGLPGSLVAEYSVDNVMTLVGTGTWILLSIGLVVGLALAIVFNLRIGIRYRSALAQKLVDLRLERMLVALGISPQEYLHHERVVDIHEQMRRCGECGNTALCDDNLQSGSVTLDSIGYCRNEQSLQKLGTRQETGAA